MNNSKFGTSLVQTRYIPSNKFKTIRLSVAFAVKTDRFTAAAAGLLCKLLTRSCEKYPTHVELSKRLNTLYGASLKGSSFKIGDVMVIKFTVDALSKRFALEGEDMTALCGQLLKEAIFCPKVKEGVFDAEDFAVEKRQLIDTIDARINEKRSYAILKMLGCMYGDHPFGVPVNGFREDAEKLTPENVYDFWQNMIKTAPAYLSAVGENSPETFFEQIFDGFDGIERNAVEVTPEIAPIAKRDERYDEETMEVSQGKLVMGFATPFCTIRDDVAPLRMLVDIFGGSPYSLLFTEVREKQSLCYYCAARLDGAKGIVIVDSGVESENFDKAKTGIIAQLDAIKNGNFDDKLIEASKMGLKDTIRTAYDSTADLEGWYLSRIFDREVITPEQFSERIDAVTREQIIESAKGIRLDTVYLLKGNGQDDE